MESSSVKTESTAPKPVSETPQVIDATTLTACVWVLYRLNMITRIQVRDFLDIIKKGQWPVDVVAYLQSEVSKIG